MARILHQEPAGIPASRIPAEARAFHEALEGYRPTPLLSAPDLAAELGVARVDVKLETDRLGLPSFKIMGAAWAAITALRTALPASWRPADGLAALAGRLPSLTLVAATDGNHGRALARVAALLGLPARIYIPEVLGETRARDIACEGAEVVRVTGTYDEAVERSARESESSGAVLVSDTSWPGYESVPMAVIDGYATILEEAEQQLSEAGHGPPDLVLVQLGVGAFGAAVIRHFRREGGTTPRIVGVEPEAAACVMASLAAGRRVDIPGPHESIMAGLNCGTPSLVAWPYLRGGLDAVIAVDDAGARAGVDALAATTGAAVGECSGAAVAAARGLLAGPHAAAHRRRLELDGDASVLMFATEGVTGRPTHPDESSDETKERSRP